MILRHRLFNCLEHQLLLEGSKDTFVINFKDRRLQLVVKADLLYKLHWVVEEPFESSSQILLIELLSLCLEHISLHCIPRESYHRSIIILVYRSDLSFLASFHQEPTRIGCWIAV